VQGDPFAAPSKVRLVVPPQLAALPETLRSNPVRTLALEDLLGRRVRRAIDRVVGRARRGSGKSGKVAIDAGAQQVLERSAAVVHDDGGCEVRIDVGLPAAGRRILGREAGPLLLEDLPAIARQALMWGGAIPTEALAFVDGVEDQETLRARLESLGLVAFIADGSILPRESGASDRPLPMSANPVPFRAPEGLAVEIDLPHRSAPVRGLGIPEGVTLIVGGGYHGKSTVLRALERGVYPHIPGDGRELVATRADAVKIRAEDGRRVEKVDVSPFIGDLPYGRTTTDFSSDAASGSTSQAANIVEALEAGSRLLLIDEDTSATNFMVRDARMQALVAREHEPITPLVDRIKELHERRGVSTVLVVGGAGDYFDDADTVIRMKDYLPDDATARCKEIARSLPTRRQSEAPTPLPALPAPLAPTRRVPDARSFDASRGRRDVKISARATDQIAFGNEDIDLRAVEQLVDTSQTRAIGLAIQLAVERCMGPDQALPDILDDLDRFLAIEGLDALSPAGRHGEHPGRLALPRRYEIAAAINRLRTLRIHQVT
jgi:predicted ABC-class ATPase